MVIAIGSFSLVVAGLVVAFRTARQDDPPAMLVGGLVSVGSLGLLFAAAIAGYSMLLRIRPKWPSVVALAAVPLVLLTLAALLALKHLR